MGLKHLIVRLGLAVRLAARLEAQVTGLYADAGTRRGRADGAPRTWREAGAQLDALARSSGVESACWKIDGAENEPGAVAARYCRYGDLAIVGQHDPEAGRVPADFGAQVLLESGGPVLVVPFVGAYGEVGRRVVLAWDGSREAARALKDALPLIQKGAEVRVALVHRAREDFWKETRSGPSVTRLLASHGLTVEREPVLVDQTPQGVTALDAILNLASDVGADLVVMGARGRHGGPFPRASRRTRATLSTMTAPVLLSA